MAGGGRAWRRDGAHPRPKVPTPPAGDGLCSSGSTGPGMKRALASPLPPP
eukprot:CAMPEP_0174920714 /NCGR_PEP_ID=MMETSP1355-20121228/4623_1 /TAXON_ID=464990 /ORGANISM="Hemiselmis tepida, Strain CCMP443" /LENGTH=49 /DNA_ID= /DNA_START= /DNA_END= /DNA_ORIENTATION=